jgi:hypothetical protein
VQVASLDQEDFQLGAPMYWVGFPYLGEEFAVNARLPGPGQRWFRHGAVLAGYVCLAALAIASGRRTGGNRPAR